MTEHVPAVPITQTVITAEEAQRVDALIEELSAEQAKAEGGVLKYVHRMGERLTQELQPTFDGNRCSVGEYGNYAMERIAEALGYDRSYLYLSMQFKNAFPEIVDRRSKVLTDGSESREHWSFRDLRLVLPLNDAQRAEAVDWYSHPWQEGDYLIPASDVYPGERCPRHLYGTNKTRHDLELYVRFLRAPKALVSGPLKTPSQQVQEQAREAASVFARYLSRAPALMLSRLPVALKRVSLENLSEGDHRVLTAALTSVIEQAQSLQDQLSGAEDPE